MKNLGLGLLAVLAVGFMSCDDDDNDNDSYNLRLVKITESDYQVDKSLREYDVTTLSYNDMGQVVEVSREHLNDKEAVAYNHISSISYDTEGYISEVEIGGEMLAVVADTLGYITSIGDSNSGFEFEYNDKKNLVTFSGVGISETKFTWVSDNVDTVVSDSVETSYTYDNKYNYLFAANLPRAIILAFDLNYGHSLISLNNVERYTDKKNEGAKFIREYVYNNGIVEGFYTYEILEDEDGEEVFEPYKSTVLEYERY